MHLIHLDNPPCLFNDLIPHSTKDSSKISGKMSTDHSNSPGALGKQILELAAAYHSRKPSWILNGENDGCPPLNADDHSYLKSAGPKTSMIIDGYSPSHLPYSEAFCSMNSNFKVFDTCREGMSLPVFVITLTYY